MNLPKCPHGNDGEVAGPYAHRLGSYTIIRTAPPVPTGQCSCAVFAHDKPAALRAWAALCSPVTDERLLEIVENATPHHDACKPLDGWCSAPCRFDRQERYDIARAVRDACEGKP